ncbi:pentapeptide repeat-containing protein [Streptomyces sp. ADI95-17]|uniref:pentapeptide repeat-containing protein n=1 Tax=Streptomyces sp. ADI95-17 TaxID=1522759 RepID=UPI000F5B9662|nr:pentapeptide repeat-containing protein [Streptomyces sp. ADI95-17]
MWLVAPVALILVSLAAFGLYQGADALLTSHHTGKKPVDVQDIIKVTVTILTLVGAVLAGLYAYRKQLLEEGASHRADATQLAERYAKAAEQLGHEQAAVRLAGVYSMARLADDWPEQRQVCIDVLCAYLRMPYETDPTEPGFKQGEKEVRLTIISTIRDRLQYPKSPTTWCGYKLDFTGATFDGGDFSDAAFFGGMVDFGGAAFSGGAVNFGEATFSSGLVNFRTATFSGGTVYFGGAAFSGGMVDFFGATFSGDTVYFGGATFSSGRVYFGGATFSGGRVYFGGATFSGGTVDFGGAAFSGGTVDFTGVEVHAAAVIDWGPFPEIPPNHP